jgi:hypothetical protein
MDTIVHDDENIINKEKIHGHSTITNKKTQKIPKNPSTTMPEQVCRKISIRTMAIKLFSQTFLVCLFFFSFNNLILVWLFLYSITFVYSVLLVCVCVCVVLALVLTQYQPTTFL